MDYMVGLVRGGGGGGGGRQGIACVEGLNPILIEWGGTTYGGRRAVAGWVEPTTTTGRGASQGGRVGQIGRGAANSLPGASNSSLITNVYNDEPISSNQGRKTLS